MKTAETIRNADKRELAQSLVRTAIAQEYLVVVTELLNETMKEVAETFREAADRIGIGAGQLSDINQGYSGRTQANEYRIGRGAYVTSILRGTSLADQTFQQSFDARMASRGYTNRPASKGAADFISVGGFGGIPFMNGIIEGAAETFTDYGVTTTVKVPRQSSDYVANVLEGDPNSPFNIDLPDITAEDIWNFVKSLNPFKSDENKSGGGSGSSPIPVPKNEGDAYYNYPGPSGPAPIEIKEGDPYHNFQGPAGRTRGGGRGGFSVDLPSLPSEIISTIVETANLYTPSTEGPRLNTVTETVSSDSFDVGNVSMMMSMTDADRAQYALALQDVGVGGDLATLLADSIPDTKDVDSTKFAYQGIRDFGEAAEDITDTLEDLNTGMSKAGMLTEDFIGFNLTLSDAVKHLQGASDVFQDISNYSVDELMEMDITSNLEAQNKAIADFTNDLIDQATEILPDIQRVFGENQQLLLYGTADELTGEGDIGYGGFAQEIRDIGKNAAEKLATPDESGQNLIDKQEDLENRYENATGEEREKIGKALKVINETIQAIEDGARVQVASIQFEREKAHEAAMYDMQLSMGQLTLQEQQQQELINFVQSLRQEGYTAEQIVEQRDQFNRQQALELEKSERALAEAREDNLQSIYEQISAYADLEGVVGEIPAALQGIAGFTQMGLLDRDQGRQFKNLMNDAGISTIFQGTIERFISSGSENYHSLGEALGISAEKAEELTDSMKDVTLQTEAQKFALTAQAKMDLRRLQIANSMDSAVSDALDLQVRINEIRMKGLDEELEAALILAEQQALRLRREQELDDINSSGYRYSSPIQEIQNNLTDALEKITTSLADPDIDDETREHLLAKQAALPAKAMREIAEINRQLLADLESIGRSYSEIGNVNRGFADNIERIGETHGIDMAFQSLADGISDEALFEQIRAGRDLTEQQNRQIREAIAGRRRELELIKEKNREEGINKAASFFGASNEMYTYQDFTNAMEELGNVLKSLDDTIDDIYYSDLNPIPMLEKMQKKEEEYQELLADALSANPDGSYDADAISAFQNFVGGYLEDQAEVYASSGKFLSIQESVLRDVESVKAATSVYGTKSATDKLIEGMGELKTELQNLGVEDGTVERVDSLITKVSESLPEGVTDAYTILTHSSAQLGYDVDKYSTAMVTKMKSSIGIVTSDFANLFDPNSATSLSGWVRTFTTDLTNPNDPTTLAGAFHRFIEDIKGQLKSFDSKTEDNATEGQSFSTGTNGQSQPAAGMATSFVAGTSLNKSDGSLFYLGGNSTQGSLVENAEAMYNAFKQKNTGEDYPFYYLLRDKGMDFIYGLPDMAAVNMYTDYYGDKGQRMKNNNGVLEKFAMGGLLHGPSHMFGGMPIEAEGGEYIMKRTSVDSIGVPYLNYLNDEGDLPFFKFGMGDFYNSDMAAGVSEVNSSDGELKALVRELIQAIQDGDKDIVEALDEIEPNVDVSVFSDLEGEVEAQISAYDYKLKESLKRGLNRRI